MTMKNSRSRITKRRQVALANRIKNVATLTGQVGADSNNEDLKRKLALAESEVIILKKATGQSY